MPGEPVPPSNDKVTLNLLFIDLGYYILWKKGVCRKICIKQWFYKSKHMNPKFHTREVQVFMWEGRKIFSSSFTKKFIPQSCFLLSLDGRVSPVGCKIEVYGFCIRCICHHFLSLMTWFSDVTFEMDIISWEPEGRYHYSKMFHWEPGRYHHRLCTVIGSFWFSTEHLWLLIVPFWLSTDNMSFLGDVMRCTRQFQILLGMNEMWRLTFFFFRGVEGR